MATEPFALSPELLDPTLRKAAVLGDPIHHSRSPRLHGAWLQQLGIAGRYVPLHVRADQLTAALDAMQQAGFAGCNLTLPHKEAALALMDTLDDAARAIGAVNTVVFQPDGTRHGLNTDAEGFIAALQADIGDLAPYRTHAVVMGAGGATRAVLHGLLMAGIARITLINRTRVKAEALADHFGPAVQVAEWNAREEALHDATLLVNATALGMVGQPPLPLDVRHLPRTALVTDIVYTPLETPLLAAARLQGCRTVDGLGMLLYQARAGFAAWFGVLPEVTPALRQLVLAE